MMTKRFRALLAAAALTVVAAGCDGVGLLPDFGNPEPIAQFMPGDVTLDVGELPDGDSAKSINSAMAQPDVQRRSNALNTCGGVVHGFHRAAARALALGAAIRNDMTSPDNIRVAGEFTVGSRTVAYLADFSAFDFDGDGNPDGSGNAVDVPVALRIWADRGDGYQQFLCALITVKPTESTNGEPGHLGAGRAYVRPASPREDESADLQIFMAWDRTNPAHKWNDAYISGNLGGRLNFESSHHRVDHRTYEDEHVEKTVRSSANFAENPFNFETFKSSAHFSRGAPAALFSVEATGSNVTISFTDQCVNFESSELDAEACADFDTSDVGFIAEPQGDETAFPSGFPADPTFTEDEADNRDEGDDDDSNENSNDNSNGNSL